MAVPIKLHVAFATFSTLILSNIPFSAIAEETENCILSGENTDFGSVDASSCIDLNGLLDQLDLTVPENPLFAIMGSTPDNVIKPQAGEKVSLSWLPGLISGDDDQPNSVAVEINPGLLMAPKKFTYADLADLKEINLLSQLTLSASWAFENDTIEKNSYGAGFSYVYDSGSPLRVNSEFTKCAMDESFRAFQRRKLIRVSEIMQAENIPQADALEKLKNEPWVKEFFPAKVDDCIKKVAPWNRTIYGVGGAIYHSKFDFDNSDENIVNQMNLIPKDETGIGAWGSAAFKVGDSGQFVVSGRWNDDLSRTRTINETSITEKVDGVRIGARYTQAFSNDDPGAIRGFAEIAHSDEKFSGISDRFTQAGIGLEIRLRNNLYFQAAIGDTFGSEIDRDEYLSGQLKWSFSKAGTQ